ncbi:MAG TPA: hypothetical protein VE974_29740 [Thermoanaerobaculia bacterium]|nr:hypothetical protein [Thermoanaerobaculia bacterium]
MILPALLLAATAATVTLDVKDADVRVVLKSMQQQCGIRNLLIDKEVRGEATILFRGVPCATAFKVVFRQFGLTGQVAKTLTTVEPRRN